jgi:hypothetical protein
MSNWVDECLTAPFLVRGYMRFELHETHSDALSFLLSHVLFSVVSHFLLSLCNNKLSRSCQL